MQNVIKIIFASVFALTVGFGFLHVGSDALSRGFFYMSKYSTKAVLQQESPVIFPHM